MKENYCTYEQCVALKRLGFDWDVRGYYTHDDNFQKVREVTALNHNDTKKFNGLYSAPRLDQAAAWMREQWGTHISVNPHLDYSDDADGRRCAEWHFWAFDLMSVGSGEIIDNSDVEYESYEEALSGGISAFLESLEEDIRANELLEKEVSNGM